MNSLDKIKEETKTRIKYGKKLIIFFSIFNLLISLISWIFDIYSWPLAIVNILLSIMMFYFSFIKYIWVVNSLYRSYWYLALLFSMIDGGWSTGLGIICILALIFDIYSLVKMFFSKSIEEYLYEKKQKHKS